MSKLVWDADGARTYETGTKNGVLYPKKTDGTYDKGVAWNGLASVTESPSGAEESPVYADDIKYLSLRSAEEFGCTIEAYTYPKEWKICDGSAAIGTGVNVGQQYRRGFGFCYRTVLGNDSQGESYGYKLHIVYNGIASPSEKAYQSINDSPEAVTFSWEVTTTAINIGTVDGVELRPSSIITIDSTEIDDTKLKAIEAILYGTDGDGGDNNTGSDPRLIMPSEIIEILNAS